MKDREIRSQRRFGEFLQEYRSEFGAGRSELSDKIGVTRMKLARLESGYVDIDGDPETLLGIANSTDTDTIDIYANILARGGLDWGELKKIKEVLGID